MKITLNIETRDTNITVHMNGERPEENFTRVTDINTGDEWFLPSTVLIDELVKIAQSTAPKAPSGPGGLHTDNDNDLSNKAYP